MADNFQNFIAGEWVEYTINVAQSGNYDLGFRVANTDSGGIFHAEIDAANVTGPVNVTDTNSFAIFGTVTKSGAPVLRATR